MYNISKELRNQFYELKSEVLKRLNPHTAVYIYRDSEKGEGLAMDDQDRLFFKFYPMTGADGGSGDIENVVEGFQTFKKYLSDDECIRLAIESFKQLIKSDNCPYFT